ncbi:hypothetical protein M430DRAFT_197818 [Amorphotheca resinae ATCC 22711]|uniref:Uncharacterized protein n=1 Tax=Amorphotheca resinae ATCC 22711 TaxID=857342 RepID=A0A2T3B9P5_AMORE|nr:hypothetical protein M430DRAFT_197818 [Amorphotheca resinae ATCC 22711]PSS25051.1 hypothetical protein M430DRAFT_197818 [Amorphotheca resinae ATCC 22711]
MVLYAISTIIESHLSPPSSISHIRLNSPIPPIQHQRPYQHQNQHHNTHVISQHDAISLILYPLHYTTYPLFSQQPKPRAEQALKRPGVSCQKDQPSQPYQGKEKEK